jgi:hypothetical protein
VPVTFTEKLHDAPVLRVALERLTLPDPAVAVIVPAPQLPETALGVATSSPAGRESVKPTPVSAPPVFGFARLKVNDVLLSIGIVAAPKVLDIVGGERGDDDPTVIVADAVFPVPPSFDVTALVVLFSVPVAVAFTFTEKLHDALAFRAAPERLMFPAPAPAVMVPPHGEVETGWGVATTSPAGRESVKPTPVSAVPVFGFARLKVKDVLPFTEMVAAPKVLVIIAGEVVEFVERPPSLPLPQPLRMTSIPPIARRTYRDNKTRSLNATRHLVRKLLIVRLNKHTLPRIKHCLV